MTSKTTNKLSPEVGKRDVRSIPQGLLGVRDRGGNYPSRWTASRMVSAKVFPREGGDW